MSPRITCGAIIEKAGKVLLTKRNISPYRNYWCIPGGHVDWGETMEGAVKREVKEETGLDIKPKFFNYYDEIIPRIKWHAVSLTFVGKAKGSVEIDRKEVREFGWFAEKEIKGLKLAFRNRRELKDYFRHV